MAFYMPRPPDDDIYTPKEDTNHRVHPVTVAVLFVVIAIVSIFAIWYVFGTSERRETLQADHQSNCERNPDIVAYIAAHPGSTVAYGSFGGGMYSGTRFTRICLVNPGDGSQVTFPYRKIE